MDIRPKVLVTKIGLDGHDRGSRIVAAYLRDAGMEVIYTPPWQEIATVVKLATEEDVDVIGISSLATDHLIVPKLVVALRDAGCALLVVSEELDELFEISDRLVVIAQGRVSPSIAIADANIEQIGEWMSGLWDRDTAAAVQAA